MRITLFFCTFLCPVICSNLFPQTGWFITPGVTSEAINDLNVGPANFYWMICDNGTVFKSSDAGENWINIPTGANNNLKSLHQPASNQLWIAGDAGTVIVSTNSGTDWSLKSPGTTANFRSIFSRGSGVAYVIGDSGSCFFSEDLGLSWEIRTVPTNENLNCGIGPVSGTSLIALIGGNNGVIFKTIDAGINWTLVSSGISGNINALGFGGGGKIFAVGNNGSIITSSDAGDSWSSVTSPTGEDLFSIDNSGLNANWIIACGSNGTIIKTTDNGVNWFLQSTPTSENLYSALAVSNSVHFAGANNGTLLKTIDGGGNPVNVEQQTVLPEKFSLDQNYPNPFNPSTKISWQSPVSDHQSLKIFDVLGNEVATLVDEYKPAGSYEVEFSAIDGSASGGDASQLTSGIYLYKLSVGDYIETKKMILIK